MNNWSKTAVTEHEQNLDTKGNPTSLLTLRNREKKNGREHILFKQAILKP